MRAPVGIAVTLVVAGAITSRLGGREDAGSRAVVPVTYGAGDLTLFGRVIDEGLMPLENARVRAQDLNGRHGELPIPVAVTDARGRFAFAGLGSGPFRLWIDAGAGERRVPAVWLPGQGEEVVRLPAAAPSPADSSTAVRVVGPDGGPVFAADVSPWTQVKDGWFVPQDAEVGEVHRVLSPRDAEGRPLPFGPGAWSPGTERVVRLPVGRVIEGQVVDDEGHGVPDAWVAAYPKTGDNVWRGVQGDVHARATTDERGRLHLVSLADGEYLLLVQPLPPHLPPPVVNAVVGTPVTVRVESGHEVEVTVLDAHDLAVAGAVVSVEAPRKAVKAAVGATSRVTGSDGRVRLSQIDVDDTWVLRVRPPRSRRDLRGYTKSYWRPADPTVRLSRGWTLSGTVQTARGAAQSGVVWLQRDEGRGLFWKPTRADGTFEVRELTEGPWRLAAASSLSAPRGPEVRVVDPREPLVLTVAPEDPPPAR